MDKNPQKSPDRDPAKGERAPVPSVPPDTYHFRSVLTELLIIPCIIVWLIVGLYVSIQFHIPPSTAGVMLVMVLALGLGTAYGLGLGVFLLGHAVIAALDRRFGEAGRRCSRAQEKGVASVANSPPVRSPSKGRRHLQAGMLIRAIDSLPKPGRQFTVRSIFVWITATALFLGVLKAFGAPVHVLGFSLFWLAVVAMVRMWKGFKLSFCVSFLIGTVGAGILEGVSRSPASTEWILGLSIGGLVPVILVENTLVEVDRVD
jgi:hypothetical protein